MHKKRTKDLVLKKSWPRILWISDRHSSTDLESSILPRFGLPIKTLDFIRMKTSASLLFFSEETPIPGAQMAMCCTWIISRSPRDHDLLNLSSPLALHLHCFASKKEHWKTSNIFLSKPHRPHLRSLWSRPLGCA